MSDQSWARNEGESATAWYQRLVSMRAGVESVFRAAKAEAGLEAPALMAAKMKDPARIAERKAHRAAIKARRAESGEAMTISEADVAELRFDGKGGSIGRPPAGGA